MIRFTRCSSFKLHHSKSHILGIVASLLFITGCSSGAASNNKKGKKDIAPITQTATPVTTSLAGLKRFEYLIQANGKIKSLKEQSITADITGRLLICNAKTGSIFLVNKTILKYETTSIEHRLQRAMLQQFNAQREYESQLLGYENLMKDKSKEEADDIRQKLRISSGLAIAEQDIKEATYELGRSEVKAPFSGVLADVKVQQGQIVRAGEELYKIYDPQSLMLEIKVLEADVNLLNKDILADVTAVSASSPLYRANLHEINPYVDENGMVAVRLKILNGTAKLFPGMNCTAVIKIPMTAALLVPKEAVVMRDGKPVVFSVEAGKAKWNYVVTGRENGKEVEILSGLNDGQVVIISNNLQLGNDAPVKEQGSK
jgi:membrane fusion protein, multidrug efflux system